MVAAYDGPGGLSANVSLANGDGTLAAAQYSKSATGDFSSYAAHVGDFDGDGISDLVWTKSDGSGLYAQVALANGDGTLAAAQRSNPATGSFSGYTAHSGDFNGDGLSDLVWANAGSGGLRAYVALGNGDGTLATAQGSTPRSGGLLGLSGRCR